MFYNLARSLLRAIFLLVFRWRVIGHSNIPTEGPVLVAANHISFLDPPVVGCAVRRRIHYMAKAELFEKPMISWLLRHLNAFPVKRGAADRAAIRTALDLLARGVAVGLFPEGTRSKEGKLLAPQHGVAMLAIKAGAAIIPTGVVGTNRTTRLFGFIPFPDRIQVKFGEPIFVDEFEGKVDKETVSNVSQRVMQEIQNLLDSME